jgi:hypothetical protein
MAPVEVLRPFERDGEGVGAIELGGGHGQTNDDAGTRVELARREDEQRMRVLPLAAGPDCRLDSQAQRPDRRRSGGSYRCPNQLLGFVQRSTHCVPSQEV